MFYSSYKATLKTVQRLMFYKKQNEILAEAWEKIVISSFSNSVKVNDFFFSTEAVLPLIYFSPWISPRFSVDTAELP